MESQFFLHCTCPICYLPYDTQERIPRFITCTQGHTICSKCITIQIGMQDPFQCPFDKQLIIMLDNVISRFPINRALASIIEEGHSNCEVHIDKKLDLVCRPCRQQICDRCERKGPHTGHEVSVIEEALDEAKQKMDSIKQLVQKVHQSMDASQAEINLREQALLNEIDVKFSECIALLLKKRGETQLLVREHCQRIKDLVEMEALAKEDSNLVKIMNWSNVIEKQTTFMNGLAVQPVFYDLLEEDIESLNQNVDALIVKEQERIQNIVKDIEKITVNFSPHLEHTFEFLCEVINISREERSEDKDCFTWKADWNKLDLLADFRTAEEMQFTSFVDKIIETYKFRLEAVQHLSQSGSPTSPKMPPFYLCSFSCFLGSDPKCSKLLKWYILDSTLQNSDKKVKLDELKLSENLFQILVEKINKLPEQIRIEGLLLKKEEKELLKEKIKEYGHKSLLITHLNFLLASYMKDRWIDACYAADQIIKIGEKDSYIEKVMKDATRVNCLRLALVIEKAIEAQETEEAIQLINYLQGLVKSILDGNELHASQAQAIISEAVERLPEEASQQKQLKERLSQFNSAGYSQRELSKTLQDYIPTTKKVQVHIEGECQEEEEEVHYWEEKGENSAYKMKQLTNEMLKALEPYVDFHNHLNTVQQIVTYEERKNLGYLYKESVDMSDI